MSRPQVRPTHNRTHSHSNTHLESHTELGRGGLRGGVGKDTHLLGEAPVRMDRVRDQAHVYLTNPDPQELFAAYPRKAIHGSNTTTQVA